MKLAIVHDYLNQYGGAERVIEVLHKIFPKAYIFTSIYIPKNLPETFKNMEIHTSFMQKLPFIDKHFKKYLFLYPIAIESFNFDKYDIVLSSSTAFAKGIKKSDKTCHICYCNTPMRFVWDYDNYVKRENVNKIFLKILQPFINKLKKWDLITLNRVDYFIANSYNIKNRIKKLYNRDSEVIYPSIDVNKFKISQKRGDYFLIVSRLNSYKRIDLVINAFNELNLKLKIVGDGPHKNELLRLAKSEKIEFLGKIYDEDLYKLYSECKALIFPGSEDFGLTPIEAQASGRPVIAFKGGGALETILEEKTGIFFEEQSVQSLKSAIKRFLEIENRFNPLKIREHALKFDESIFKNSILNFINEKSNDYFNKSKIIR